MKPTKRSANDRGFPGAMPRRGFRAWIIEPRLWNIVPGTKKKKKKAFFCAGRKSFFFLLCRAESVSGGAAPPGAAHRSYNPAHGMHAINDSTDKTLTSRNCMCLENFGIFTFLNCYFFQYFVGTSDTCTLSVQMTCLSAYMYRQISQCTDKFPNVPTNFQMYRQKSEKALLGGGGNCPPGPPPPPPLSGYANAPCTNL